VTIFSLPTHDPQSGKSPVKTLRVMECGDFSPLSLSPQDIPVSHTTAIHPINRFHFSHSTRSISLASKIPSPSNPRKVLDCARSCAALARATLTPSQKPICTNDMAAESNPDRHSMDLLVLLLCGAFLVAFLSYLGSAHLGAQRRGAEASIKNALIGLRNRTETSSQIRTSRYLIASFRFQMH
jgi:hypothetical protein